MADNIEGNWATLLLPLDGEAIRYDLLAQQIDCYIQAGVDGIYSNGTAGEFYTQSDDEYQQISRLLADKCHTAGMAFQIGASHCHPQQSLDALPIPRDPRHRDRQGSRRAGDAAAGVLPLSGIAVKQHSGRTHVAGGRPGPFRQHPGRDPVWPRRWPHGADNPPGPAPDAPCGHCGP